jgi:rubrerythrin
VPFDPPNPTNSIVWSLKRLFDRPSEVEREVRERQAELRGEPKREGDPPTYRCRVCAFESQDAAFCPECLADTMEVVHPAAER